MQEENKSLKSMIWERFLTKAVDWIVVALIGVLVLALVEPVKDRALAIWNTPEAINKIVSRLETALEDISDVRMDIQTLRQPTEVFEVSIRNTRPIEGYCVEREPCDVAIRIRRLAQGAMCSVVQGSTLWGFVNPRDDVFTPAQRLDSAVQRNIGMSWTTLNVTILTPVHLHPEADFVFEVSYTGCTGTTEDTPPLTFRSIRIPFQIWQDS